MLGIDKGPIDLEDSIDCRSFMIRKNARRPPWTKSKLMKKSGMDGEGNSAAGQLDTCRPNRLPQ